MSGGKTALGLDTNVGALLCYLPVCGVSLVYSIIVLVTEKSNKLMRFHALQSLLLTAVIVILSVAISIVSIIFAFISTTLSALVGLLFWLPFLAFIAIAIYLCVKAYGGDKPKLPVVGDMADKWA